MPRWHIMPPRNSSWRTAILSTLWQMNARR
jgi:hypothetical protein